MSQKSNVVILGHGEMGRAMEYLLGDKHRLFIWDKYPADNFTSADLDESASQADYVIFCLPVNPHREVAEHIAPLLHPDCICISIAKGLDENGQTAAQIFSDVFSFHQPYALLYGPMISEEIRAGHYAFAEIGCSNDNTCHRIKELFQATGLITEISQDITGITWSVILKNVYALVFGMADGLQLGDNVRGFLAAASLKELNTIVQHLGGKNETPYSLAGLGDLITTATSKDSHHYELGRKLARGETKDITGEGIHTLEMVNKFHILKKIDCPLFEMISESIDNPGGINKNIENYIKRLL